MTQTAADMVRQAMTQIESVSPKDAFDEMTSDHVAFLDVREPVEWEDHITGAVQVPRGLLEFVADPASPKHNPELDPERRVIVYCRSGTRAALATPPSRHSGSRTSPTSRAASAPGRKPAFQPTSTTRTSRASRRSSGRSR